jgi:nicotinamide-nucleotide amidase
LSEGLLPEEIETLARRVVEANKAAGRTIVTAESCTGGLVAAALTEVPGSSAVLERGFVTYSNDAKMQMLDVSSDIIEALGAVSVASVWAMAKGALDASEADVAVAISGIAGPGGGSEHKPVGTVVFALAKRGQEEPVAEMRQFGEGTRAEIRKQATLCALELLMPED